MNRETGFYLFGFIIGTLATAYPVPSWPWLAIIAAGGCASGYASTKLSRRPYK